MKVSELLDTFVYRDSEAFSVNAEAISVDENGFLKVESVKIYETIKEAIADIGNVSVDFWDCCEESKFITLFVSNYDG